VPEVNPQDVKKHKGIIANPNCSTIILNVVLWPLHKKYKIKRVVVSTYQASSGAGQTAMDELLDETQAVLKGKKYKRSVIPHPYAFNLFPHNDVMLDNGYNKEEMKMVMETRKIFHAPRLKMTATCVRVPILRAHSETVNIEFSKSFTVKGAYALLKKAKGVKVFENRKNNRWGKHPFPMPCFGCVNKPLPRQSWRHCLYIVQWKVHRVYPGDIH